MSVSSPVTTRRRPITVSASRTAPVEWLDDEIVLLEAGVALALPESHGRLTVKALGAGCAITSAAGIESPTATGPTDTVSSRSLASMESLVLAADSGSPWKVIAMYLSSTSLAAIGSASTTSTMQAAGLAKVNATALTSTGTLANYGESSIDTTSAAVTITLPAATGSMKRVLLRFKAGSNACKVAPASGEKLGYDYSTDAQATLAAIGDTFEAVDIAAGVWGPQ